MRNPQEERKSALVESLEACGLSDEQLSLAEQYLNGEVKECALGIERQLVYKNYSGDTRDVMVCGCVDRLSRHKESELLVRYFLLLFQIFGTSLQPLYSRMYSTKNLLPEDIQVALEATAFDGNSYYAHGGYWNLLRITDDREKLRKAISHVEGKPGNVVFYILSAFFHDLSSEKTENGFETNEYVKKYPQEFQKYLAMFPDLACQMGVVSVSDSMKRLIRQFIINWNTSEPMPKEIVSFGTQVPLHDYHPQMIINFAVANYRLSPVIYQFLRIFACTHMEETFEIMFSTNCRKDMQAEVMRWRDDFAPDDEHFILWLAKKRRNQMEHTSVPMKLLAEMTKINPDAYVQALKSANPDTFQVLSYAARNSGNSEFVQGTLQPLISLQRAKLRQNTISKLTPTLLDKLIQADIADFLSGKKGIDVLYPHESAILANTNGYGDLSGSVQDYALVYGLDDFYDRALAFLGFRNMEYSIMPFCQDGDRSYQIDTTLISPLLERMVQGGLDIARVLAVAGMIQESYRGDAKEKMQELVKYFSRKLIAHPEEMTAAFQTASVTGRLIGVNVLNVNPHGCKEELLAYVGETSKQVKEELVRIYVGHEDWMEDFLRILKTSKKAAEREMAATVLAKYPKVMEHHEELQVLVETEKSKKVADLIREILRNGGVAGMDAQNGVEAKDAGDGLQAMSPENYIKECHKGGKKRGLVWIYDQQAMPEVHFDETDEKETRRVASEEYLQAVLLSYSGMDIPGVNKDVSILTDSLNKSDLAAYMDMVYEKFMAQGAEAKKKWVLYAVAIHGGARIVPKFQRQINEWAECSRGAMAAEAVRALTLNDSPTALLIVDGIARKYKFKQVRKAAQDAMAFAAAQLGLTVEELADRIVPDLGFDEKLERHFDYGNRSFTVKISPSLEIEVKDESGKKIKSLPAVGRNDDEAKATAALEEFKELKKQMKATVKNQALRLELAMSLDRKWTVENWKKLFVKNPIMHQFAISLIWGHYKDEQLLQTFRYMEDGTFNTVEEEEYELTQEGKVGLVHPIELDRETIEAWKEQLFDYEITQAIEQLDRQVFKVLDEEKGKKRLERFGGKLLNGLSLAGKLTGLGWSKGMPEDAGVYYEYYRKDVDAGLAVELQFSGAYIADENDEVTVYDAGFYHLSDFDKRGYSRGKDHKDLEMELDQVPPRYFSEMIYQLTKATVSSTETDEDWKNEL